MKSTVELLIANPLVFLYIALALTYAVAARMARHEETHKQVWVCYFCSSCLHCGIAICHLIHLG